MELLEGETLAHRLEKGPLPVAEVLSLARKSPTRWIGAHRAAGWCTAISSRGNVMLTRPGRSSWTSAWRGRQASPRRPA